MNSKILVGASSCVLGEPVRFDAGHKMSRFVVQELSDYFQFLPVCPEVGMGMPVPRATLRLEKRDNEICLVETKNPANDHTQRLQNYTQQKVTQLLDLPLCGYIVCAKSPSCGMERVKLYQSNQAKKEGVGLYTQHLMQRMPWLPVEEDGRLHDPLLRENFILRVYALHDLQICMDSSPDAAKIIQFHSRYKLTLMAHHPDSYRKLGQLVANIKQYPIDQFYLIYREQLMSALAKIATRKNNTNVLMHIQGYFKRTLTKAQKAELTKLIEDYRLGHLPLLVPITLIKHYLATYPDDYLQQQHFLNPYPQELGLRYGL